MKAKPGLYIRQTLPRGQTIQTKYRTLQQKEKYSLLEVDLLTGRTHQIRAHMASIGHPLVGDGKYGKNTQTEKAAINGRPFVLISSFLTFKPMREF